MKFLDRTRDGGPLVRDLLKINKVSLFGWAYTIMDYKLE